MLGERALLATLGAADRVGGLADAHVLALLALAGRRVQVLGRLDGAVFGAALGVAERSDASGLSGLLSPLLLAVLRARRIPVVRLGACRGASVSVAWLRGRGDHRLLRLLLLHLVSVHHVFQKLGDLAELGLAELFQNGLEI